MVGRGGAIAATPRVVRLSFAGLAAASLALAVALVIAWAHGYRARSDLHYSAGGRDGTWERWSRVEAQAECGGCALVWPDWVFQEPLS